MSSLPEGGSPALSKKGRRKGYESAYATLKAAEFFVDMRRDALGSFRHGKFTPKLAVPKKQGVFKDMKHPPPSDATTRQAGAPREESRADGVFWEKGFGPTWAELDRLEKLARTPPIELAGEACNTGRDYAQNLQRIFVETKEVPARDPPLNHDPLLNEFQCHNLFLTVLFVLNKTVLTV
jgi:hypothetical protein